VWDLAAARRSDRTKRSIEPALLAAELQRRKRRRIAAFERTADLLASGVLQGAVADGTLRRLGETYRFRSERWTQRRARPTLLSQFVTMFVGVMFACAPGVAAYLLGWKMLPLYAGAGLLLGSPLFVAVAYRSRYFGESTGDNAVDQAMERFANRCCVDCNHDLSKAASALPVEPMEGTNIGPRACPNCGTPWPLVPPG
jgi:hypothetical protein